MTTTPTPADEKVQGLREALIDLRRQADSLLDATHPNDKQRELTLRTRLNAIQDAINIALSAAKSAPQEAQVAVQCHPTQAVNAPRNGLWDSKMLEQCNQQVAATPPREVAAVEPANFATRTICTADAMASVAESLARQGGAAVPYGWVGVKKRIAEDGLEEHEAVYHMHWQKPPAGCGIDGDWEALYTRAESPSLPVSVVREAIAAARIMSPVSRPANSAFAMVTAALASHLPESERHLLLGGKS